MCRHIMGHRWFMGRWFYIDYNKEDNETNYLKLDGSGPERVGQAETTQYATKVRTVSFGPQVPVR